MSCSNGLNIDELSSLREEVESWLDLTCNIYRTITTDDVYGGADDAHGPTPLYANLPCALESGAGQENSRDLGGKIESVQIFTVILPALTDIHVTDHVVVTTPDTPELHLYVQAELAPESYELERKVIASQIGIATHA